MAELDLRAQHVMQSIDTKSVDLMKKTLNVKENLSDDEKKVKLKDIQELYTKAKEYGDDKVQLAIQTYELVDKHIRRLDSDLARFEGEIQDKTVTSRGKSEENVTKKGRKKTKDAKVAGKKKRPLSDDEEKVEEKAAPKSSKKQKVTQEKESRKAQKVKHRRSITSRFPANTFLVFCNLAENFLNLFCAKNSYSMGALVLLFISFIYACMQFFIICTIHQLIQS